VDSQSSAGCEEFKIAQFQLVAAQHNERWRRTGTAPANERSDSRQLNESHNYETFDKVKTETKAAAHGMRGMKKTNSRE
jgi:hypothetical protein